MNKSIIRHGLILCLFALLSSGLIALTHVNTAPRIKAQEQHQLQMILNDIIDTQSYNNPILQDCTHVSSQQYLGSSDPLPVFRARKNAEDAALAIEAVAPDGYGGKIYLIVGVQGKGQVTGVRVLKHKETPGLGDKIDIRVSDWILGFNGKELNQHNRKQWQVKKDGGDFDAFTGATITPRAVVTAVAKAVEYYQTNRAQLFLAENQCADPSLAEEGDNNE